MPSLKAIIPRKINSRFNLKRRFLKKNKSIYTREELFRKFHREHGYCRRKSRQTERTKRTRKTRRSRGGRKRRVRRGGGYDTDEETDYNTESE
jgi:hypothetical protein